MMSSPTKSKVMSQPKPVNVFYVWYSELCRRLNSSPAPIVKPAKTKCETVLDFVGDRLKVEEWNPVIKALRQDTSLHVITIRSRLGNCQFLHDIDTEEKARRMKRKYGTLWTAYILKSLLKSLSYSIRNNQVLTCLELDGLPMFSQYLEPLLQALKKNKTIKSLSFAHCPIKDIGCQMVCGYLRFTPNVEIVNFSSCLLTAESGEHLSKLIKYQQINRYCESWHNSLRYEEPNVGLMRGIKRITLNGNPNLGDDGLCYILNELEDDLWIKALDFQKCGITENITDKILDVVEYNQALEIVDFRLNQHLSTEFIEKVFTVLKQKQQFGYQPEFKWCSTMLTLPCTSIKDDYSSFSMMTSKTNTLQKSKSAPMKDKVASTVNETQTKVIRRTKTEQFPKKMQCKTPSSTTRRDEEKNKLVRLNSQLHEEIIKRKQIERQNEELKKKLEQIQSVTDLQNQLTTKDNVNKIISVLENFKVRPQTTQIDTEEGSKEEQSIKNHVLSKSKNVEGKVSNGYHQNYLGESLISSMKYEVKKEKKNGYKNGYKNGGCTASVKEQASHILENLLIRNKRREVSSDDDDDGDLINYYIQGEKKNGTHDANEKHPNNNNSNGSNEISYSQVSLISFIEELKNNNTNLTINFKNQPHTSKLSITEKDGGT